MPKSTMVYFRLVSTQPIPDSTAVTFTVGPDIKQMTLWNFCRQPGDADTMALANAVMEKLHANVWTDGVQPLFIAPNNAKDARLRKLQLQLMGRLGHTALMLESLPQGHFCAQAMAGYRRGRRWTGWIFAGEYGKAWKKLRGDVKLHSEPCVTVYVISQADAAKLVKMYRVDMPAFEAERAEVDVPKHMEIYRQQLEHLIGSAAGELSFPHGSYSVVSIIKSTM